MLQWILWVFVAIMLAIMAFMFIIKAFISGKIWDVAKFLVILLVVLYVYYNIMIYIHAFYISMIPSDLSELSKKRNMIVWDNIWYAILIVFVFLLCTVFIKALKKNDLQFNLILNSVIVLGIFIFYNIIYYLYVYYDKIVRITFSLTIATFVGTLIVWLLTIAGVPRNVTAPIYIVFSILVLTYLMALFVLLYYFLSKTYDFLR